MSATTWRVALAVMASAGVAACAHGAAAPMTVLNDPDGVTEEPRPDEVARWEAASALFAELDGAGVWNGEACHRALTAFEGVGARGRRAARAVYMAGLVSTRCGNTDGARQLYRRALEVDAALCEPRVGLGLLELEAGRPGEARRAFEAAIAADAQCAPAYVNLAILQSDEPSERDDAIANLRRALAVRADYLPALDRMALVYLLQSEERPELLDLAEVVCRQAQLIDPSYAPLYNTWGLIDVEQGELTSAAAKFARAMELDPRSFEAHMNFGQITLGQRAYADAARAFERARALRPGSYDAALGLGVALRGLRHPERAEAMYRAAMDLDGERPEAWFDLAVLYHEHREGSPAQLRQALDFLAEFVRRARPSERFSATVREVVRWCAEPSAGRRRRAPSCSPGRAQNLVTALSLLENTPVVRPDWAR